MLHQIQSVAINILTIVGAAINAVIAKKKGSPVKTKGKKFLGIGLYAKRKAPAFAGAFVGNTFFSVWASDRHNLRNSPRTVAGVCAHVG